MLVWGGHVERLRMCEVSIWVCLTEKIDVWARGLSDRDLLRLWEAPTKGPSTQMNKKSNRKKGRRLPSL